MVIGILAVALIPRLTNAQERAKDSTRKVKIGQVSNAISVYKEDFWSFPIAPFHITSWSLSTISSISDSLSPYLSTIPTDAGKWVAAKMSVNSCVLTGDSFAYSSNISWSWFAVTALSESKKGNTSNCLWVVDSNNAPFQNQGVLNPGSTASAWGQSDSSKTPWVYYIWDQIMITNWTPEGTYVIRNRNVWASISGTTAASYGCHFQWWNNYCFSAAWTVPTTESLVDASNYWPPINRYNHGIFIISKTTPFDWSNKQNDNIRGDTTSNATARQWPCEVWYHVPSQREWSWLVETRQSIYTTGMTNWNLFRDTLLLPMAGYRAWNGGAISSQSFQGNYWSSTPNWTSASRLSFFTSGILPNSKNTRANGMSVRCFKN